MARKEIDTPRSSKRRKLDQTEVPKSSPIPSKLARKRTSKEKELDLYDDIDGGLTKSEPRKRRGWKGWVEIDEDEDEEVAEEEEIVATPSKRQAKLKAKETLSSLAWMQNGKSKGMPKNTVMTDNWDREEEVQAVAYKGSGRSTVRKQGRTMSTSPEAFLEDLPDAESPTKTPSRRKRGVVQTKTTQEDEEMEHIGAAPKSTGRRRRTTEEEATVGTPSKSRKRPRRAVEEEEEEEEADEEQVVTRTPSKGQKQRRQQRQLDDTHDEPEAMDLDPIENEVETISSYKAVATNGKTVDQPPASDEITLIKSIVLSKLTQRRPVPLMNLDSEYAKVHQLLEATVTSGESNSMLLIGARGSGKTALINKALLELSRSQKEHFHIVRLNGFIQTDDKLALREIWRQLGREMEIEDDEGTTSKSYADTLAMLLALLSHPDEISGERGGQTAKSVLFIMDEFDLFATHPRQTLLYNLLDIAQSRKAPIAVLGLTTRIDVTEALEKRVKSRFSHRYVHLNLARTLGEFVDAAKAALKILPEELGFEEKTVLVNSAVVGTKKGQKGDVLECWNRAIDSIFANTTFQKTILHPPYHTSKSLPTLFSSILLPTSSLTTLPTPSQFLNISTLLTPPSSNLHLLASLSNLALSLLIAAARLSIIHNTTTTNFPLAYAEYVNLASKARINANAAGQLATGSGMRVYGKEVARREWEGLFKLGLCVRVGGGAFGAGIGTGAGGGGRDMVRVDVALEEIPLQVELGMVMEKWCKQI